MAKSQLESMALTSSKAIHSKNTRLMVTGIVEEETNHCVRQR